MLETLPRHKGGFVTGSKFYDSLKSAGYKPEAHIFSAGGHGFGMRKQGTSSDRWIDEFYFWLEAQGFTVHDGRVNTSSGELSKVSVVNVMYELRQFVKKRDMHLNLRSNANDASRA